MRDDVRFGALVTGSRFRRVLVLLTVAGVSGTLLAGCMGGDRICRSGEYPVKHVGTTTGRTCVPDGEEPPAGYVKYPAGKVPKRVGDKWDEYWSTVIVDDKGNVVQGPTNPPE
jgi:hypothetical protein